MPRGRVALLVSIALGLLLACSPLQGLPVYEPIVDGSICAGRLALSLSQARLYADATGRWWLIGEVQNTLAPRADYADVVLLTQADAQAPQQVERLFLSSSLPLRRSVPFRLLLRKTQITERSLVKAAVCLSDQTLNSAAHEERYYAFMTKVHMLHLAGGVVQVSGEVRNSGEQSANEVYVVVGLYDARRQLAGVAEALVTDLVPIAPGETYTFTATTNRLLGEARHYMAFAEGIVLQEAALPVLGR